MNRLITALTVFLPTTLFADEIAPAAQAAPSPMSQMLVFGSFIAVFYFLIWRPQSKRAKAHRQLITALEKGDEVVISGGLLGKVERLSDAFVVVSIADGVEVKVQKNAITGALPKGTLKTV